MSGREKGEAGKRDRERAKDRVRRTDRQAYQQENKDIERV